MRLSSRQNDEIDDGWLCNRGRWGFDFVNSAQRLRTPLIRQGDKLEPATWEEAYYHDCRAPGRHSEGTTAPAPLAA